MSQYEVVFDSNGTTRTLGGVEEVKAGNDFLQCYGEVNGDDQLLAKVPFDAVCYIVHEDVRLTVNA
ncbi:hypothetical protein [Haloarchaeobius baliensis]|uniref:hypothetical protein n=1 Tax=Haloarchaeobius baliensis TaxID=1670458 RepID=UPI003F8857AD